jgi:tRNA(fMet)-specific endonuclease VapC
MRYLIDTSTCIAIMRNHPKAIQRMSILSPGECVISTVTSYELYTGVAKCANPAQERAKVDTLLKAVPQVPFESSAAIESARIRALLESQGQSIGPYDLLLAGQAIAHSLVMVTANVREFSRVPGLTVEDWSA